MAGIIDIDDIDPNNHWTIPILIVRFLNQGWEG